MAASNMSAHPAAYPAHAWFLTCMCSQGGRHGALEGTRVLVCLESGPKSHPHSLSSFPPGRPLSRCDRGAEGLVVTPSIPPTQHPAPLGRWWRTSNVAPLERAAMSCTYSMALSFCAGKHAQQAAAPALETCRLGPVLAPVTTQTHAARCLDRQPWSL